MIFGLILMVFWMVIIVSITELPDLRRKPKSGTLNIGGVEHRIEQGVPDYNRIYELQQELYPELVEAGLIEKPEQLRHPALPDPHKPARPVTPPPKPSHPGLGWQPKPAKVVRTYVDELHVPSCKLCGIEMLYKPDPSGFCDQCMDMDEMARAKGAYILEAKRSPMGVSSVDSQKTHRTVFNEGGFFQMTEGQRKFLQEARRSEGLR
jgi:hypothetical protein